MMEDLTTFQPWKPHFPEQEQLKCPRCQSLNTKFCYYNNYNLSQPRHFCKNCKRYWTKGGALRNVPVGGGSRKGAKRPSNTRLPSSSSPSSASTPASHAPTSGYDPNPAQVCNSTLSMEASGSFSSLLELNGHFGGFSVEEGLASNGSHVEMNSNSGSRSGSDRNPRMAVESSSNSERYLSLQNGDSSCWSNGRGWPDLAIFTPGSSFQ